MNQNKGYLYIRFNEYLSSYAACKMGITKSVPDRESTYITSEVKPGYMEDVYEIPFKYKEIIEKLLQIEFKEYHIYFNGATEIYKKEITNLIEPYLIHIGIKYRKLSKQEISDLLRYNRARKTIKKINIQSLIHILKSKKKNNQIVSYIPRNDQTIIIEKSVVHFQQNNKGLLVLICGVGKTLISLWITQKLNSNRILIGVPSLELLYQWEKEVMREFQNIPYLLVSNVDIKNIKNFLETNQKCIVLTTYSSAHKVYAATKEINFKFDIKVLDETHHLTSSNMKLKDNEKTYIQMLRIPSVKQLGLTATLKLLENNENLIDDEIVVSNDNIEHFGEIIDKKGLLWAINENIICDYLIQTIITNEEQLEKHLEIFHITEENDKRLFLSAFASLKSIDDGHSHHLFIYSNTIEHSSKIIQYIKMLLDDNYFDIPNLYYSKYNGEMNKTNQKKIISKFEKAKFGIITCVYALSEGNDLPYMDAVVFAENMTSSIRIVQSALRPIRKNINEPYKKAKIILPILNKDEWLENENNLDLKKVKEVIYQMGLEDETIIQKIKVFKFDIEKQQPKPKPRKKEIVDEFGDYDDELTQKIRLKTIKRTALSITYEKARKIIADKNIKNKESYYELCEIDNRLPKDPKEQFGPIFTNWIEYLSIQRIYYDLETCKNKVDEYLLLYPEIKEHYLDLSSVKDEIIKIDPLFPPSGLWVEYYNVKELRDIITITNNKKKMGAII